MLLMKVPKNDHGAISLLDEKVFSQVLGKIRDDISKIDETF